MLFGNEPRVERSRKRACRPGVESVESRTLLSTFIALPGVHPARALTPDVAQMHPFVAARARAAVARHRQHVADALAARQAAGPVINNSGSTGSPVGESGKLAVTTAWKGYWLTHSKDVAKVGVDYGKLTVSHDSRKLAYSYLHAALRGDTKTLNRLGHTNLVKKVGHDFSRLGSSSSVKTVGHKFKQFGNSVTDQFHKIFG